MANNNLSVDELDDPYEQYDLSAESLSKLRPTEIAQRFTDLNIPLSEEARQVIGDWGMNKQKALIDSFDYQHGNPDEYHLSKILISQELVDADEIINAPGSPTQAFMPEGMRVCIVDDFSAYRLAQSCIRYSCVEGKDIYHGVTWFGDLDDPCLKTKDSPFNVLHAGMESGELYGEKQQALASEWVKAHAKNVDRGASYDIYAFHGSQFDWRLRYKDTPETNMVFRNVAEAKQDFEAYEKEGKAETELLTDDAEKALREMGYDMWYRRHKKELDKRKVTQAEAKPKAVSYDLAQEVSEQKPSGRKKAKMPELSVSSGDDGLSL